MFCYLLIVTLLAAATARTIPENCGPHFVNRSMDFPRSAPPRQTTESRGTGDIDQGNGEAILQEKPRFDEFRNGHGNHENHRPIYQEQPKYFDNFGPRTDGGQENRLRLENDRTLDTSHDDNKNVQEKPLRSKNLNNSDLENAGEHKNHNFIQHKIKTDKNFTEKRDEQNIKVGVTDFQNHSLHNRFDENQPKTNLNSTDTKTPIDNEVFIEGRTVDNNLTGNGSDDRWIWGDTITTVSPTDLNNRAAFDGGKCPTGQVRVKGSDMCVDIDLD